jgi:hypothetical protein
MKKEVKQIGSVGVDSGQLIICDPCYIDSEWEKEEFEDIRIYEHISSGARLQYHKDFSSYDICVIEKYGKTMNQLLETKEWKKIESPPAKENFSYNAVCIKTLTEKGMGQLNYRMGHEGVAVAFRSGLGDGVYPVYAEFKNVKGWGKRITKVWIDLI